MLKTFSLTDIGKKRKINQDFIYTAETPIGALPNLFLVADGMGGHKAGDYAARVAVDTIVEVAELSVPTDNPFDVFARAIEKANEVVHTKAATESALEGMGTTVVVASCIGNQLFIANVGDSRLYIVADKMIQVTRDHSLVEEMVRFGTITREEARNHPKKNIITRAVGVNSHVEPEFFKVTLEEGDIILMCTDGLTNMLEDEEIRMIIKKGRDLVEMSQNLVDEANNNGGKDNISVVLIDPLA